MSTKTLLITLIALIAGALPVYLCITPAQTEESSTPTTSIANPASVFCIDNGGSLSMTSTDAGEMGSCAFPSGEQCEEWALFRGECDVEGVSKLATYSDGANIVRAIYRNKLNTVIVNAPHINMENVLVVSAVSASGARYETPDKRTEFWEHQGELTISIDGEKVFVGKITE